MKHPRYIPENAETVTRAGLPAIVYTYTSRQGKPAAIAYYGNQSKPIWHYQFLSAEQREQKINALFESVAYSEDRKLANKIQRASFKHGYQVGDILYASWGYDQTNIDFYQVTATTEKTVTFQEIAQDRTATGFMSHECTPMRNAFTGLPYTRAVKPSQGTKGLVKFAEHENGYMRHLWEWDGKPKHSTSYA